MLPGTEYLTWQPTMVPGALEELNPQNTFPLGDRRILSAGLLEIACIDLDVVAVRGGRHGCCALGSGCCL
ncbi:MAG: hypothetical protein U5N53_08515, partial [Mycobacterium sp.]|nr:hypothetical protein [Mycobacterium sp.]